MLTAATCLLLIAVALSGSHPASALECYLVDDGLPARLPSTRTQACPHVHDSCFEYEANAKVPPVYRLAYFAGCGRPDMCHVAAHTGNCSVCSTDRCNSQLLNRLRDSSRVCYSYFSSYDSIGVQDVVRTEVLCPSGEADCFQVHFPAGSAYSTWTQFTGGCGSRLHGCTREFNYTQCSVCAKDLCNPPSLPAFRASDQTGAATPVVRPPPTLFVAGAALTPLALLLVIGAGGWAARLACGPSAGAPRPPSVA